MKRGSAAFELITFRPKRTKTGTSTHNEKVKKLFLKDAFMALP